MRLLKEIGMWIWAIAMLCILAPIIYFDAWVERRERKRKFGGKT